MRRRDAINVVTFQEAIGVWSAKMSRAARREGWDLFNHEGEVRIERFDENPHGFTRDDQVVSHCIRRSLQGSRLHLLALYLEGRPSKGTVDIVTPLLSMVARGSAR